MRCENNFCVYCNKYECTLDKVNINNIGFFTECILIDLDENVLNEQKKKILSLFEE